ncbi:SUMO ligase SIZ1 KNAG_0C04470 [Huiozyma naganishii CBS 8797]|uniref:SP-RING-type domain-containing protein n=1 Tax=Huiozyma naganishii (strain ATCC MYA-139 / BCRC 22969 / CBS 8797 / KCTC 17520 / NBRC 10181 / NCYC 3082 / Yp74L-3) TaxID=1071383 RepID=J7S4Y7_HUIN7|nr:hypothetical protein KNAG_0C04470 [Kazachstania naganishii CBS 8797]CCK69549.1 hypothetical protein KNAG_0C04470 [Kazachstania naganishii CBS 8797]
MLNRGVHNTLGKNLELTSYLERCITRIQFLKVAELKLLCKSMELKISGKKAVLQENVTNYIKMMVVEGKEEGATAVLKATNYLLDRLNKSEAMPLFYPLYHIFRLGNDPRSLPHIIVPQTSNDKISISRSQQDDFDDNNSRGSKKMTTPTEIKNPLLNNGLHFKESPFFKLKKVIPESAQKVLVNSGRGTCKISFRLSHDDYEMLVASDSKYKLYLFCGMYNSLLNYDKRREEPIQFPNPNEIQFNGATIKDNVKGLKSKKGTAKPADLTPYINAPNTANFFQMVYACTLNEFLVYIYIVETFTPEQLLTTVLKQPKIIKNATLYYLKKTHFDSDNDELVATSSVMSLQCPISYTRLKYPAKSAKCKHMQCFDALWFLHSQIQLPTWQCPVCQIPLSINNLAICEYVDEILKQCPEETEQVRLFRDGSWEVVKESDSQHDGTTNHHKRDSDDRSVSPKSPFLSKETEEVKRDKSDAVVISLDSDESDYDNDPVNTQGKEAAIPPGTPSMGMFCDGEATVTLDPKHNKRKTDTPISTDKNESSFSHSASQRGRRSAGLLNGTPLNNGGDASELSTPTQNNTPRTSSSSFGSRPSNVDGTFHGNSVDSRNRTPDLSRVLNTSETSQSTVIFNPFINKDVSTAPIEGSSTMKTKNPFLTSRSERNIPSNSAPEQGNARKSRLPSNEPFAQTSNADIRATQNDVFSVIPQVPTLPPLPNLQALNKKNKLQNDKLDEAMVLSLGGTGHISLPHPLTTSKKPIVPPFVFKKNRIRMSCRLNGNFPIILHHLHRLHHPYYRFHLSPKNKDHIEIHTCT